MPGAVGGSSAGASSAGAYYAPPPSSFHYLIEDYAVDVAAADIQNHINELGAEGWQLLFVNQVADNLRAWFIRGGTAPTPHVADEEQK
jgi:hypothetical protein